MPLRDGNHENADCIGSTTHSFAQRRKSCARNTSGILYTSHVRSPYHASPLRPDQSAGILAPAGHRTDRHLIQLQEQGLRGVEERHRVDGRLSQPPGHPPRRAPARPGFRRQPHPGARGDGAARAGGFRAFGAAPRHLYRAQDQDRGDRDDHRLGRAGKHGSAADHRACQRRGNRFVAPDVRDLRRWRAARPPRRIFGSQHRIPPEPSSA